MFIQIVTFARIQQLLKRIKMSVKVGLYFLLTLICVSCGAKKQEQQMTDSINNDSLYLLVGTYTEGESTGIYVYNFNSDNGEPSYVSNIKNIDNPSYLKVSPDEKFVYAVKESGSENDAAYALRFDKRNGTLTLINSQPTQGSAPCYINMNKDFVVTANYGGGNITVFPLAEDGSLKPSSQRLQFTGKGADEKRQAASHLHCVEFSPDGKYLFANDLGADQIYKFVVNKNGSSTYLTPGTPASFKIKPGCGPRHLVFHPNGKYAYLITELSGEVLAFNYEDGNLKNIQYIEADKAHAKGSGDIHISPDGKFLYASNRLKDDGIAIFGINGQSGLLTNIGYQLTGIHPRNFIITPNGKYLLVANRDSNNIQIFERDLNTGLLNNTEKEIKLSMPVCLKFIGMK